MSRESFSSRYLRRSACLITAVATFLCLFSGCQTADPENPSFFEDSPVAATTDVAADDPESMEPEPTEPEPTEPEPTAPPDGNPEDVTCQGSYTGTVSEIAAGKNTPVATIGDIQLTNAQLQIYYQMAVNGYREAGHEESPDFSKPLDVQLRDMDGMRVTWQQYFLQQALNNWQSYYAMAQRSKTEVLPLEEAYGRNEEKHAENLKTRIYNLDLLYGYNTDYKVADAHQEYLDNLEAKISLLAQDKGFKTPASLVNDFAGIGTNDTYLLEYARAMNEAYMLTVTLSYYMEPKEAEVEAYFAEHEAEYAAQGITRDDHYVNLRHILLTPNGTTQEDWDKCKTEADALLAKWNKSRTEANFADLAFANSKDTGSSVNGGLYANLSKGQLTKELDDWCFDAARKAGDTTIIKTADGYHILYMSTPNAIWYEVAEADLIAHMIATEINRTIKDYPMEVDYSAIILGLPGTKEALLSPNDLLYPDIAHERFPVAPLYFQQDYPNTMYGRYSLVTYGCGVTTMSMLVSYMTDEEWTPPELCALYGKYCTDKGTAHAMFTEVPTDRGFYTVKRTSSWDEAKDALEEGYMVVTLQREGYWTRGGHYLLLHNLLETEDGTMVQVRDSNLYNYKRLEGHTTGYFSLDTIPRNSRSYWIYQKKVTNLDSCVRCAQLTADSHVPAEMFVEDYLCTKCAVAVNRRDAFLEGSALRFADTEELIPEETVPEETVPEETTSTEVDFEETFPDESDPDDHISTETLPDDPDHDFS